MKIWKMTSMPDDYNYLSLATQEDERLFDELVFDGREYSDRWVPLRVIIEEIGASGDMPGLRPGVPVFTNRAIEVLKDLLQGSVELLPLECGQEQLSIVNTTQVKDCIDHEKAVPKRLSSGRILRFIQYAFNPEAVRNEHIFKIAEIPKTRVFVSDTFRNRVLEAGLKGFEFTEVWDSEK